MDIKSKMFITATWTTKSWSALRSVNRKLNILNQLGLELAEILQISLLVLHSLRSKERKLNLRSFKP